MLGVRTAGDLGVTEEGHEGSSGLLATLSVDLGVNYPGACTL